MWVSRSFQTVWPPVLKAQKMRQIRWSFKVQESFTLLCLVQSSSLSLCFSFVFPIATRGDHCDFRRLCVVFTAFRSTRRATGESVKSATQIFGGFAEFLQMVSEQLHNSIIDCTTISRIYRCGWGGMIRCSTSYMYMTQLVQMYVSLQPLVQVCGLLLCSFRYQSLRVFELKVCLSFSYNLWDCDPKSLSLRA